MPQFQGHRALVVSWVATLLLLGSGLLFWPGALAQPPGQGLGVGAIAADFRALTPDGQQLTLHTYRGRPIVLNFWATWCKPCREEMPLLQAAYRDQQATGLVVLAVSQDGAENLAAVRDYLALANLTFPTVVDTDGAIAAQFQVLLLPSTVFIDPNGSIAAVHLGPLHAERLAQYLALITPSPG